MIFRITLTITNSVIPIVFILILHKPPSLYPSLRTLKKLQQSGESTSDKVELKRNIKLFLPYLQYHLSVSAKRSA